VCVCVCVHMRLLVATGAPAHAHSSSGGSISIGGSVKRQCRALAGRHEDRPGQQGNLYRLFLFNF
jgi:hypothetical protein